MLGELPIDQISTLSISLAHFSRQSGARFFPAQNCSSPGRWARLPHWIRAPAELSFRVGLPGGGQAKRRRHHEDPDLDQGAHPGNACRASFDRSEANLGGDKCYQQINEWRQKTVQLQERE